MSSTKYSFGLNEEFHNAVVALAVAELVEVSKRNSLIKRFTSTSSVIALWKIIAKNEFIELTLLNIYF